MKKHIIALSFLAAFSNMANSAVFPSNTGNNNSNINSNQNLTNNFNTNQNLNNNSNYNRNSNYTSSTGVGVGIGQGGTSHSSSSSGGNIQTNSGNNSSNNSSSGGNTQSNSGNNSTNNATGNNVTVSGDTVTYKAQDRNPANTAYAAPLTASNGTCMGSTSGGIQGIGLGISVGSTWTDSSCDMRYDAEALRAAGLPGAAQARLCQKKEIAAAMEAAGTPCPKSDKGVYKTTYDSNSTKSSGVVNNSVETYTDPIIRQRLGLPPL